MAKVLVLYAHPGQRHTQTNDAMAQSARTVENISFIDLYARYPRFKIDIDAEQRLLCDHDVLVFQFPLYWYSTPALLKEWQDLVLEHGFAYGTGGDKLKGKWFLCAVTAGGTADAYRPSGYNHFELRTLLAPLEQTASLCQMTFLPPFALFAAQKAREDGRGDKHAAQYKALLEALRDDRIDLEAARKQGLINDNGLPVMSGVNN